MTLKPTQYKIGPETIMNADDILDHYKVHISDLFRVFDSLQALVEKNEITVEIVDLSGVEDSDEPDTDHAETCTSDGKTIYLHDQLKDHGGILTRIYYILHMGCGHLIQWGADETSGITWYGDKAWNIGSVFHGGADEDTLTQLEDYEFEAGKIGLSYLKMIIKDIAIDGKPEDIIRLYNDYVLSDKRYIINYYRTQKSENFFSARLFDQDPIDNVEVPIQFTPKQRTNIQIGIIRADQ